MLYYLYEMNHAAVAPWRAMADAGLQFWKDPGNLLGNTYIGRQMAASLELFERATRRYGKPEFGIDESVVNGIAVGIDAVAILEKPFELDDLLQHVAQVLTPPASRG